MALRGFIRILSVGAVLIAASVTEASPHTGHGRGASEWRRHGHGGSHWRGGFARHHSWHRHGHHGAYVRRHWRRPFHVGFNYPYPNFHYSYRSYPIYAGTGYDYGFIPDYRPSYAGRGLLLGALAGGILGNNSGDLGNSTWGGAALGAAAGYIAGTVADTRARSREAAEAENASVTYPAESLPSPMAHAPASEMAANPPAAKPVPQSRSSMASANKLFGR